MPLTVGAGAAVVRVAATAVTVCDRMPLTTGAGDRSASAATTAETVAPDPAAAFLNDRISAARLPGPFPVNVTPVDVAVDPLKVASR
jgi:hypothetical protein